jgi:hypothetical protein
MADKNKPDEQLVTDPQADKLATIEVDRSGQGPAGPPPGSPGGPPFQVAGRMSLTRADVVLTDDAALWAAIRNRTDAIRADRYGDFIDRVLCEYQHTGRGGQLDEGVLLDIDTGIPVCGNEPDASKDPIKVSRPTAKDFGAPSIGQRRADLQTVPSIYGVEAYNLLKLATQAFLLFEAGVAIKRPRNPNDGTSAIPANGSPDFVPGEESRTGENPTYAELSADLDAYLTQTLGGSSGGVRGMPYLKRIVKALLDTESPTQNLPYCFDLLRNRFTCPSLLELIWSYWHEEGMLVQTMNAICMRFQNRRGPFERDPLANLEIDPLRPLNNLLWGYIQDEYNRLTVPRRAYEYDHHYGLKIVGKAIPELRSADSRSKFIEAFHNLLYRTASFYREDADTTVIADGFSLLSSLREVHLLLAEGAHNQFGDLPWTSRAEMLMMQWLLARPEMREFLRGRAMVPYNEKWMGQVDSMKKLQGWTDTSITHFRNLAVYGEQMLLSIRYGNWNEINDQDNAKTWARYWRPEVQGYIHSYLSATGVDLSEDIVDTRGAPARYVQPSLLLEERVAAQDSRVELQCAPVGRTLKTGGVSFAALPGSRRRALNPPRRNSDY